MRSLLLLGSFLLLVLAGARGSSGPPQDDAGRGGPTCIKCNSTGVLPCNKHPRSECELEGNVLFCSVFADCEKCRGVALIDCPRCDNKGAEAELEEKRKRFATRGEKLKWVDETWNDGRRGDPDVLRKVESENFVLVWEMEGMKVGKRRLTPHQMMHLYVDRLEQILADYVEAFQTSPRDFRNKCAILVWYLESDQLAATLRFCGSTSKRGIKFLGSTPRYSVCANRQYFKNDELLHCNIAHSVGHLLLSHQNPSAWIGNKKYGWADEGLAHWFEDRYFGRCLNYCYQETSSQVDYKSGKYKPAVRKLVSTGKVPAVAQIFSRTSQELTPLEHAVSFSYVDYLLALDGAKFNKMMKMFRRKVPARDALRECYEMNPLQFEVAWKEWVMETYPAR